MVDNMVLNHNLSSIHEEAPLLNNHLKTILLTPAELHETKSYFQGVGRILVD